MKVLLTNDDGIAATGLQTLRRALLEVPGVELATIAPDSNRSATARSITTREPLWVEEIEFEDGTTGYATDGRRHHLLGDGRGRARGRHPRHPGHSGVAAVDAW
jgi:5'/3'-nucleotidase SurE